MGYFFFNSFRNFRQNAYAFSCQSGLRGDLTVMFCNNSIKPHNRMFQKGESSNAKNKYEIRAQTINHSLYEVVVSLSRARDLRF